ncbi:MAG TPA: AIR synthase-related protein, partial [Chthoniobacterales bacterium]|nr:AIR synthase-related protein [Chthoniobacterales bacterium]
DDTLDGLQHSLGEELLRTHKNYQPLLRKIPVEKIHGLAHITGGGLIDNVPRVLPKNCDAVIKTKSWRVPTIFEILREHGGVAREEMYQVFNMGIGMVAIVSENDARDCAKALRAKVIGRIEAGRGVTRLIL